MPIEQEHLTVDQLATHLGISPATIRDWRKGPAKRGPVPLKLTASRQGRILFPLAEIAKWKRDPAAYERRHRGPRS